ncbi:MAG TPA: methyltransferase domain-containing protein [Alphaproteobacteria bacterium]|jgi:SAM-dependent methyltransferase|nr:methyltransferase domain-containing protein [Alphaproteobacteria bacterium]
MTDRPRATPTQETLVTGQFGPQAAAYVESPVHAQGEDLKHLVAIVRVQADARALDLGCGGGHVAFHLAPHVREVIAYDLSSEMLTAVAAEATKRGLTNVTTRQGAVESLPFSDRAFAVVMTRFSAHHWRDVPAALREARRVIKPDGIAAFVDCVAPADPLLDTYLQGIELLRDPSHVRDYSVAEWTAMLRDAGFRPGAVTMRRLPLDYSAWIARQRTPAVQADAIRALQTKMSSDVVRHFAIADDGSFTIDVATIEAVPA